MSRYLIDLAERTAATYVVAFLGLLLADGFDVLSLSTLRAAAVAAIPAALSVVKGTLATFVGDRGSAAVLPSSSGSVSA